MANGTANCILAVCCPPGSEKQRDLLARDLVKYGVDESAAKECAEYILTSYDLAPAGSLQAFKDEIAKLARENASHA